MAKWISLLFLKQMTKRTVERIQTPLKDGIKAIRDDLVRQRQISPPRSPKENRFLPGFMKSPDKQPQDAQAKQALDKDSIFLISLLEQAGNGSSAKKQGQRTGDVPGHGGSMSVQLGSPSLDPPDDAHAADLRSAAEVIRKGSSLFLSQDADSERINFVAPSQVDSSSGTLMSDKPEEGQSSMERALALFQAGGDEPLPSFLQRYKDEKERKEEAAKLATLTDSKDIGQSVLGMTFCINRRKEINRLAGKSVLSDSYCDLRTEPLFKKFQRTNSSGDYPCYCVSADILGRAIHTFQEEYVTRSKERKFSVEFDLHGRTSRRGKAKHVSGCYCNPNAKSEHR